MSHSDGTLLTEVAYGYDQEGDFKSNTINQMPDSWETTFGLNFGDPSDATQDTMDADGLTIWKSTVPAQIPLAETRMATAMAMVLKSALEPVRWMTSHFRYPPPPCLPEVLPVLSCLRCY